MFVEMNDNFTSESADLIASYTPQIGNQYVLKYDKIFFYLKLNLIAHYFLPWHSRLRPTLDWQLA